MRSLGVIVALGLLVFFADDGELVEDKRHRIARRGEMLFQSRQLLGRFALRLVPARRQGNEGGATISVAFRAEQGERILRAGWTQTVGGRGRLRAIVERIGVQLRPDQEHVNDHVELRDRHFMEFLIACPIGALEEVLGQRAKVGSTRVQHAGDRPPIHGLQQLDYIQRWAIDHVEGRAVLTDVERAGSQPLRRDAEAVGQPSHPAQRRGRGVDVQSRGQHLHV
jgi:hypothetical protein